MGHCCGKSDHVVLGGMGRFEHTELESQLRTTSSNSWAILIRGWKTVLLRAMWTMMIWVKKFQSGTIKY